MLFGLIDEQENLHVYLFGYYFGLLLLPAIGLYGPCYELPAPGVYQG